MRIAVDAMGGDYAPRELVKGSIEAVAGQSDIKLLLVGDQQVIQDELSRYTYPRDRIDIVHCTQVVEMNEHPSLALRKKKDSSIVVANSMVKHGKADALVSCGNTGAQMAAAVFILGRFAGVERPAIAAQIPIDNSWMVLLDVGANVDCKPRQLVQFALMGQAYASILTGNPHPTVALLSNGEEETKGNQAVIEAYGKLKNMSVPGFLGNIEGRDIFTGKSEVIVCDGFTGNIVLKAVEGFLSLVIEKVKDKIDSNDMVVFKDFDYHQVGGAPLLGVDGVSVVCHGSSRARAVANGIELAARCVQNNMVDRLREALPNSY